MGMYFLTAFVLFVLLIFGVAVMLTLSWIAHVRFPLNRVPVVLYHPSYPSLVGLYSLAVYPAFSFLFFLLLNFATQSQMLVFCYSQLLLCIAGTEAAYQFRKQNKWNTVWLMLNIIAGGIYCMLIFAWHLGID
jgi:hypothetical protein